MKRKSHFPVTARSSILPVAVAVLTMGIFVVDTVTDLEIAVAVFYVVVVLMSVNFCENRGVALVSMGCMALTVVSYFLTPAGAPRAGLINCMISLSAIVATTYLALKIEGYSAVLIAGQMTASSPLVSQPSFAFEPPVRENR